MKRNFFGFISIVMILQLSGCVEETMSPQLSVRAPRKTIDGYEGQQLSKPLEFIVEDQNNNPVEGVLLSVEILEGDGRIISKSKQTDEAGLFSITYRLGNEARHRIKVKINKFPESTAEISMKAFYSYSPPEFNNDGWDTQDVREVEGVNSAKIIDVVKRIRSGEFSRIHGFLVTVGGKLVMESYFPGYDSNGNYIKFDKHTPHEQQSASKSFRSLLTGIAIEQGFIESTEVPIFSFFPELAEYANGGKENISLENILTMSSGLDWNEWVAPPNNLTAMYSMRVSEWHSFVLKRPLAFDPGTKFVYNTGASIMLNRVIENASDLTIAEFTKKYFMDKTESRLMSNNANLQAKKLPRDMAKLGQVYLDDGMWKDTQVISKEWVDRSLSQYFYVPEVSARYGYQWWIRKFTTSKNTYTCHYASGNGGQFIMIVKELDLVVVFTGGSFSGGGGAFTIMTKHLLPAFE